MKSLLICCASLLGFLSIATGKAPVAICGYGDDLVIAYHEGKRMEIFTPGTGKVKASISLDDKPNGMAVRGDLAYVTTGNVHGKVQIINLKEKGKVGEIAVGHTPMAPYLRGNTLYVCNRFDTNVSLIDLDQGQVVKTLPASREAVGVTASADGKRVYIANHLPPGRSDGDYTACELTVYDGGEVRQIGLSNGTQGVRGMAMSHDGRYVIITHVLSRYQLPTTQVDRGWMNTNGFTIIDVDKPEAFKTVLLDDPDQGAANPWAVQFTPDDKMLIVSHAGSHEISLIDFDKMMEKLLPSESEVNEMGFLSGIRQRIPLPMNGIRAMYADAGKVYCLGYYSDNLVSATLTQFPEIATWQLVPQAAAPDKERLGEMYYNDASFCFQTWQSCVTCHPDARVDGLNWDLMNDGMGNPKNTRSMFISHRTPPVMTLGIRKDAETAVNAGFHHIQFVDVSEDILDCVNAYLRNMKQVASPHLRRDRPEQVVSKNPECLQCHDPELNRGQLTDAAKRGREIFKSSGCVECHPHPYYTTKALYDMGTLKGLDEGKKLVVPTLVEVWRTGPYFHDGRASSLKEVLTTHNKDDKRGKTSHLTDGQVSDLVEYVKSL